MTTQIVELAGFATFGACTLMAGILPVQPEWLYQFGAMGLVGFMIVQNYRQTTATAQLLEQKDRQTQDIQERLERLCIRQITESERLRDTLENLKTCFLSQR